MTIAQVLDKYGERMVYRVKAKLQQGNKFASGALYNSITYQSKYTNGNFTLQITAKPYLVYVDRGRRPGKRKIPIQALEGWIKMKRIPITVPKGTSKANAIRGVAFAMQNSIQKKGIKPFPILRFMRSTNDNINFKKEMKVAIKAEMKKQLKLF